MTNINTILEYCNASVMIELEDEKVNRLVLKNKTATMFFLVYLNVERIRNYGKDFIKIYIVVMIQSKAKFTCTDKPFSCFVAI